MAEAPAGPSRAPQAPAQAPGQGPAPPARARRASSRLPRAALAAAALALLLAWGLGAASMAGPERNSIHLDGAQGLTELASALREQGLEVDGLGTSPHAVDAFDARRTVLVVAGVERSYTPGEVAALVGFVERGGTLLVADDFGFGDAVGEPFGVNFDGRVMRDASFEGNQSLVRVNATAGGANFTLLTNVPSSLGFAPHVQPGLHAESGPDSYLDQNQDGVEDPSDVKGPFPVLASLDRGAGRAVFASDPGLLANAVWEENGPFLRAFFAALLPEGGVVVFDESRHGLGPLGALLGSVLAGEVQASSEPALALAAGAGGVLVALALWAGFRAPEDISLHRSRLGDAVHRSTPELTRARIRRLAARAVVDANNLHREDVQRMGGAQLASMAPDPVVRAVLLGEAVREDDHALLQRIRALARGPGAREPREARRP